MQLEHIARLIQKINIVLRARLLLCYNLFEGGVGRERRGGSRIEDVRRTKGILFCPCNADSGRICWEAFLMALISKAEIYSSTRSIHYRNACE
jgi:hypothetical protein